MSPEQNSVIYVEEAAHDQELTPNDVQPAEERDNSRYPAEPRLGCSPRLVSVPNVMDKERLSKIPVPPVEDEEAYKKPEKSSYASPKESMTAHTSDSLVKENTRRQQVRGGIYTSWSI